MNLALLASKTPLSCYIRCYCGLGGTRPYPGDYSYQMDYVKHSQERGVSWALQAATILNRDLFTTMPEWTDRFDVTVFRLRHAKPISLDGD